MLDAEHRWLHDRNTVVRDAADVPVYASLRREGFAVRLSDCRRTIEALNRMHGGKRRCTIGWRAFGKVARSSKVQTEPHDMRARACAYCCTLP